VASTAEQVWQSVAADADDCAIGCQLLQLDLAAFTVDNNSSTTGWINGYFLVLGRFSYLSHTSLEHDPFEWCKKLSAQACQAAAERAWSGIARFFENCKSNRPGKKGYPRFKKHQTHGSVEYKVDGWKLSEDLREIPFRDGFKAGTFKMWGSRDLHYYQIEQIKRVRVVRRADGYYSQFCIAQERLENHELTGEIVGLDVGLNHFLTDSKGQQIENPRFLRECIRFCNEDKYLGLIGWSSAKL